MITIGIPEVPANVTLDGMDRSTRAQVSELITRLGVLVLEDPRVAVAALLQVHDCYRTTNPTLTYDIAVNVAGSIAGIMMTNAPQDEMQQFSVNIVHFIDGAKAVLSQGG